MPCSVMQGPSRHTLPCPSPPPLTHMCRSAAPSPLLPLPLPPKKNTHHPPRCVPHPGGRPGGSCTAPAQSAAPPQTRSCCAHCPAHCGGGAPAGSWVQQQRAGSRGCRGVQGDGRGMSGWVRTRCVWLCVGGRGGRGRLATHARHTATHMGRCQQLRGHTTTAA